MSDITTVSEIKDPGIYHNNGAGVINYGRRWAGHGYIVPIRRLELDEVDAGTLFSVIFGSDGKPIYDLVRQRDTLQDARKLMEDMDQHVIYDLRQGKWFAP